MEALNAIGKAYIRFYEELNFFLPEERKKQNTVARFRYGDTVKALIESIGIPHTEVDLILVNGKSVPFAYKLKEQDRISVYPVFESFDITDLSKVRPVPLRKIKFVLDVHLGRLAKHLRMLGFDASYNNSFNDEDLSQISHKERRIVLTRDKGLLKRKIITHGYYIRSRNLDEQLIEVIHRFDLSKSLKPFSICLMCNVPLVRVPKKKIAKRLPGLVATRYNRFSICPNCNRIFWQGSHWEHMQCKLKDIL